MKERAAEDSTPRPEPLESWKQRLKELQMVRQAFSEAVPSALVLPFSQFLERILP